MHKHSSSPKSDYFSSFRFSILAEENVLFSEVSSVQSIQGRCILGVEKGVLSSGVSLYIEREVPLSNTEYIQHPSCSGSVGCESMVLAGPAERERHY